MYFHVDLVGRVCLAHKYLKFLNILSNNNMYHIHIGQRLNTINYKYWEILKHLTTLQWLYLVLSAVATIHGTSWIHGIHGTFRYFTLGLISRNINIYTYFFPFLPKVLPCRTQYSGSLFFFHWKVSEWEVLFLSFCAL